MVLQPHSHAFHVFNSCGNFLCDFSRCLTHYVGTAFSHSMNTCEPNMRFDLIDGFLDSLSCGLGRVHGHASKAYFVGPRLCACDTFIGSSNIVPLRSHCLF
jgi:hypothetical protein